MRFTNDPKVNLVDNGAFTATANSWEMYNSVVDTSLRMAVMTVAPEKATVSQLIPAESISAHVGDSCVLEASILADVHEGDASGSVSFWYWSTRSDSWPVQESLARVQQKAKANRA
jgi:hypothetical protein